MRASLVVSDNPAANISAVIGAVYLSEWTQSSGALEQAHADIGGLFAAAVARQ